MKPTFKSPTYTAYLSNKQDGNVDLRFSDDAQSNRDAILTNLGTPRTAWMKAQGESDYHDLSDKKSLPVWSEYKVDALISRISSGVALALYPADCIPLVVSAPEHDMFMLIHVGRRNAEAGIIAKLFNYVRQTYGIDASETKVFVGPAIRRDSYYFEHIDRSQKADKRWKRHIDHKDGKYHIDLFGFTMDRLIEAGVMQASIAVSDIDTGSDNNYYSHARSVRTGEREGRNMFIAVPEMR